MAKKSPKDGTTLKKLTFHILPFSFVNTLASPDIQLHLTRWLKFYNALELNCPNYKIALWTFILETIYAPIYNPND